MTKGSSAVGPVERDFRPWGKQPGDPDHPLSTPYMFEKGALSSPEVLKDKSKSLRAILETFDREQARLVASGKADPNDPEAAAFRRLILSEIAEEKNVHAAWFGPISRRSEVAFFLGQGVPMMRLTRDDTPLKLAKTNPVRANIAYASATAAVVRARQTQPLFTAFAGALATAYDRAEERLWSALGLDPAQLRKEWGPASLKQQLWEWGALDLIDDR